MMPATLATLARLPGFDVDAFLRDHWQRKPLLIRNPWGEWHNPLEPDELAGLACEPHVESRLITLESEDWNLENGPLPEDRFARLGRAVDFAGAGGRPLRARSGRAGRTVPLHPQLADR